MYIGVSVFLLCIFDYICIRRNPEFKKIRFRDIILDPSIIVKIYKKQIRNKDITILLEIIIKSEMNTKEKLIEDIRHYQCLLPRKIIGGSPFFSLIAITISIFSLGYSDKIFNDGEVVRVFVILIIGIILMFLYVYFINKIAFKIIGKRELYIKLEGYLSDIYMKVNADKSVKV